MRQAWRHGLVLAVVGASAAISCGKSNSGGNGAVSGSGVEGGSAGTMPGPGQGGEDSSLDGGSAMGPAGPAAGTGGSAEAGAPGAAGAPACVGLECNVPVCDAGLVTSISGTVFAPNGTLPLYNVSVFVPNAAPAALTAGAQCERCGDVGVPVVASTTTDTNGRFELEHVPAGSNIPLVIQVGKWRRQLTLPTVMPCADTALVDPQVTRLPKNQLEGDLPQIAIAAGGADAMECLPRRLGIDDAEFTTPAGTGRIHLYSSGLYEQSPPISHFDVSLNNGVALPQATELWASVEALQRYDLVILSCEGNQGPQQKPVAARQAMYDYISTGGRMLASHWHNIWFVDGPEPLPTTGTWEDRDDPTEAGAAITGTVNQSFPKGAALAEWLVAVGASQTPGQLSITFPRDNIQAVNPQVAREWLSTENPQYPEGQTHSVQLMTLTAPLGATADQACGRAAYTSVHVSAEVDIEGEKAGFPLNCENRDLSAQEKALVFTLFELSSCIAPSDVP